MIRRQIVHRAGRLGEVMRAGGVGRVLASNDPGLAVGDTVVGMTGVQENAVAAARI